MLRPTCIVVALVWSCPSAFGDENSTIPAPFQQHMKSMVGSWYFNGKEGDHSFSGEEQIRIVNGGTALLQEGYFDVGGGKKDHYVILSGWNAETKEMLVRGFTSQGVTWSGAWKTLKDNTWIGTASGAAARFVVSEKTMRYEENEGRKWISRFERKK